MKRFAQHFRTEYPFALLVLGVWLAFAGVEAGAWLIGVPAVLAAVITHTCLLPAANPPMRLWGCLAMIPYFARASFAGGLDVAHRAVSPDMALSPMIRTFPLDLPEGAPRILYANCISLMPGTLTVELKPRHIDVHVLVDGDRVEASLKDLETRIRRCFAVPEKRTCGMSSFCMICASVIMLSTLSGIWRAAKGPTRADRMQTAQLFGTAGTATLILLWLATGRGALLDLAVVLALLSAVTVITFTKRVWLPPDAKEDA